MKEKLRRLMESEGINATRLAEILGIRASGISHILSGRNKPSYDFLLKLLLSFPRLNPDWLMLDKGSMYRVEAPAGDERKSSDEVKRSTKGSRNEAQHRDERKSPESSNETRKGANGLPLPDNFQQPSGAALPRDATLFGRDSAIDGDPFAVKAPARKYGEDSPAPTPYRSREMEGVAQWGQDGDRASSMQVAQMERNDMAARAQTQYSGGVARVRGEYPHDTTADHLRGVQGVAPEGGGYPHDTTAYRLREMEGDTRWRGEDSPAVGSIKQNSFFGPDDDSNQSELSSANRKSSTVDRGATFAHGEQRGSENRVPFPVDRGSTFAREELLGAENKEPFETAGPAASAQNEQRRAAHREPICIHEEVRSGGNPPHPSSLPGGTRGDFARLSSIERIVVFNKDKTFSEYRPEGV